MIDWSDLGAPPPNFKLLPSLRPAPPASNPVRMGNVAVLPARPPRQPREPFVGVPGQDEDLNGFLRPPPLDYPHLSRNQRLDRMMSLRGFIDGTRGILDLDAIGTDRPVVNATGPRIVGSLAKSLMNLTLPGSGEVAATVARGLAENALSRDLALYETLYADPLGSGHPYDGIDFGDDLFGAPEPAPVKRDYAIGEHHDLELAFAMDDPFAADLLVDEFGHVPGDPGYG